MRQRLSSTATQHYCLHSYSHFLTQALSTMFTGFDNDLGIRAVAGVSFQKPGENFEATLERSRGETA